jgi:hypothetical protein
LVCADSSAREPARWQARLLDQIDAALGNPIPITIGRAGSAEPRRAGRREHRNFSLRYQLRTAGARHNCRGQTGWRRLPSARRGFGEDRGKRSRNERSGCDAVLRPRRDRELTVRTQRLPPEQRIPGRPRSSPACDGHMHSGMGFTPVTVAPAGSMPIRNARPAPLAP